jgi:hypothetical protein
MSRFRKGQRVRIVQGQRWIRRSEKHIGEEGKIERENFMTSITNVEGKRISNEPRKSFYYVKLDKLGINEYFPEDWLEPLNE